MIEFTAFRKVPFIFGLPDIPHKLNYVALGPFGPLALRAVLQGLEEAL